MRTETVNVRAQPSFDLPSILLRHSKKLKTANWVRRAWHYILDRPLI
jgi:hypothetical protein